MSLLLGEATAPRAPSATRSNDNLPQHVAIIMDGNQRWASKHNLPAHEGHKAGAENLRALLEYYADSPIKELTLFAFSSENWNRPHQEVSNLWALFNYYLDRELNTLVEAGVRMRFIGDRVKLSDKAREQIRHAEKLTCKNNKRSLMIALNYGGRWDIVDATRKIGSKIASGQCKLEEIDEACIQAHLSTDTFSCPDLCIRTGGEKRISNFMLWQMAYTELYFSEVLWPDFDASQFEIALQDYSARTRRYGRRANA